MIRIAECTNNFVRAEYRETAFESTISCIFQNPSDTSEKTCCATLRRCDNIESENVQYCITESPYNIQLEISDRSMTNQRYCYTVTANNDTYTMKVEGTFTLGRHAIPNTVIYINVNYITDR